MEKEKVVFFLDYANINRAATEKRYRLDYHDLLHYVGEDRFLIDAHCYVPINPRNEHRLDGVIEELWRSGYIVTTKMGTIAGGTYKCNFDVEITMDMLKAMYHVKPDIIVLASGDSDFVSLIQEVRKSGVRVEVAAFEETAGADILLKCSGFIDLAVYYEGYLAAQNGEQDEESIAEQYKDLIQAQNSEQGENGIAEQGQDLIQSQNGEQGKDSIAEQDQDLIRPQDSDLKDDVKLPVDQVDNQTRVPASDIIDEPGL
jgi:uncharacterized LabA/DUF88 family protein